MGIEVCKRRACGLRALEGEEAGPAVSRSWLLRRLASEVVPPELLGHVPKGFERIGDIAILNLPRRVEDYRFKLAERVLEGLKPNVRLVARRVAPARDPERVHVYEVLAGSGGLETVHKESGCAFRVDISKAFFTARLQYERLRIARMVKPGEVIVNMFAGVGPYSIIMAKARADVKVYSIDLNPHAYELMVENVKLNGVEGRVIPLLGDASEAVERYNLKGVADRVLMPSPEHALQHLERAVEALKPEGYIHYYDVADPKGDFAGWLHGRVSSVLNRLGRRWSLASVRIVRSISSSKAYACADIYLNGGAPEASTKRG